MHLRIIGDSIVLMFLDCFDDVFLFSSWFCFGRRRRERERELHDVARCVCVMVCVCVCV